MAYAVFREIDDIFVVGFLSPKWAPLQELEIPIRKWKQDKYVIHEEFVILTSKFEELGDKIKPLVEVAEEDTKDPLTGEEEEKPEQYKAVGNDSERRVNQVANAIEMVDVNDADLKNSAIKKAEALESIEPAEAAESANTGTVDAAAPEKVKLTWAATTTYDQMRDVYKMLGLYKVTPGVKKLNRT